MLHQLMAASRYKIYNKLSKYWEESPSRLWERGKRLINRIFTAPAVHVIVSLNNNKYGGLLWQKQITENPA